MVGRLSEAVGETVAAIPPGRVATYGQIAAFLGCGSPRAVGQAIARCDPDLPWHRVVLADGSPPASTATEQLIRLRAEGVALRGGKVDLSQAGWHPATAYHPSPTARPAKSVPPRASSMAPPRGSSRARKPKQAVPQEELLRREPTDERAHAAEAVFRPVRAGNAFEETVERLLTAVKLGVIGEGEKLPSERELAARLQVSRTTLREAIRSLHVAGYTVSRRGRLGGTFVTHRPAEARRDSPARAGHLDKEQLDDALCLREALEIGIATIAARRKTTRAEQDHLDRCLRDVTEGSPVTYRRYDARLHLAIAELTGSPSLVAAAAEARMRVNDLLDEIPLLERNLRHSNEQHKAIVTAILDDDPEAARRATAEHLDGTAALLRGFLA